MMDRVVRAVFAAVVVAGCGSVWADIPASAYVQSGLVAQWDGIENAGAGQHDPNATTWKNLKQGSVDFPLPSGCTVGDDSVTIPAKTKVTTSTSVFPSETPDAHAGTYECYWATPAIPTSGSYGATVLFISDMSFLYRVDKDKFQGTARMADGKFYRHNFSYTATEQRSFHTVSYATMGTTTADNAFYLDGASRSGTVSGNGETMAQTARTGLVHHDTAAYPVIYKAARIYNRKLTEAEVIYNAAVDRLRFGAVPPDGYRWNATTQKPEIQLTVVTSSGTVSLNGGAASQRVEGWFEVGSTLTITLTPAAGASLKRWDGGTVAEGGEAGTYTCVVAAPVTLKAVCGNESKTWVGASGARWDDESSWDPEGIPAAGDVVTIPKGTKVAIAESTAKVGVLDVLGIVSNATWDAALNASFVTVRNGGEVTCGGAFDDEANATRVNIVCDDLTVEKGGKIHADKRGWKGGNTTHKDGYGPGAIPGASYYAGGGHGGIGSYKGAPRTALATNEYGSASAPVTAGSGGWGGNGRGGNGGGVVTIAASGRVTVHGSVTANAEASASGVGSGAGAGGSVFITCATFQGAYGKISANGGTASESWSGEYHSGGGGRVAILFDKDEQAKLACPKGMYYGADTGGFVAPDEGNFKECLPGSLYFSSDTLIDRTGATLIGKLDFADVADKWTVDSIRLTNGWVMMARDDVEVKVTGDFEVTGDTPVTRRYNSSTGKSTDATRGTRWDVGGAALYFATNGLSIYRMSSVAPRLTVGGDLKLSHYGLLYVYSSQEAVDPDATEPATTNLGAQVTVTGAIDLSDIGKMYVKSHPRTGVSPCFCAKSVSVDATSWIDANNTGFFGSNSDSVKSTYTHSCAPTSATGKNGGGHGGAGGGGRQTPTAKGAGPFDSLDWPVLCGGSGNCDYQSNLPGLGGGVLRFFVDGEVKVDGVLRANATSSGNFSGGPAGGTVLISCDHIVGSGEVQAKGCNGYQYTLSSSGHNGGAGGGGRIALHYDMEAQSNAACAVTFNAAGGVGVGNGVYTGSGEPGTVWFPDETIASNGKSHSGSLYVPELLNFIRRDSLVVDNAVTVFEPGGYVEIAHDLTIRGASSGTAGFVIPQGHFHVGGNLIIEKGHITVSGDAAKPRTDLFRVDGKAILDGALITVECSDEDRDQVVAFGGEVVMTNATTITVKSPCDEVEGEPGLVFTAPKLEMYKDCWIYPWSHNTNGASCLFRIAELSCTTNSGFNANAKGYGRATGASGPDYGPRTTALNGCGSEVNGGNAYSTVAPGHGGDGGSAKPVDAKNPRGVGVAFEYRRHPIFAGPGGAGGYNSTVPPRGGGVIRIETTDFDLGGGTLTANGGDASNFRTGGAGGSIYVTTTRFFGKGGVLSATGGAGCLYGFSEKIGNHKNYTMQGGGGGRIAVYFTGDPDKATNVTTSVKGGNCPLDLKTCLETYGEDLTELKAARTGKDGTVFWGGFRGLRVFVR